MSTTPTGSQHGGNHDTEPTTPRGPPPPDDRAEAAQERRFDACLQQDLDDRPSGSAPPDAMQRSDMQGVQAAERATSEPARFDMLMSQRQNGRDTPSTTSQLPDFDWEDFEARYERALEDADEHEGEILKEAESLSKYFRAWASAASVQDNERAVKRLQTRQRFVNISEEKMAQKQQHYEEVVKAFESALALLRSHS
ncbi:hypothetical protein CC79DRAFT_185612 [Sarocladium strictum]